MRKFALVLVLLIPAISMLFGCQQPSAAFVSAVDAHTQVILPEYQGYVDADTALTDRDKAIRKESAQGLLDLIQEAKGTQ